MGIKMTNKKYHIVGTVPKIELKNRRKRQNTQMHVHSRSQLDTGISKKNKKKWRVETSFLGPNYHS